MMQTIASYLCRGIEAVITGLTRNQFVDNTTRGFESLPLRQAKTDTPCGCPFLLRSEVGLRPCAVRRRVRIRREAGVELACKLQARASSHSEYPSISTHSLWVSVFASLRGQSSPLRCQAQGSHLSEAIGELAHQWRNEKSSHSEYPSLCAERNVIRTGLRSFHFAN